MTKKILITGVFSAAVLFLFFFWIGQIPLWSSDEGRTGALAHGMFESKDFVLPHFNSIPYLEKPAFTYALIAGVYSFFGVSSFSTRLVPVLAALAGLLLTYFFTRRLFNARTAVYAALLLVTTVGYVLVGRFAVIDMLMTFFLSLTFFCLMTAFFEQKRSYYLLAYAGMGFAFLTKGLIGALLPALIFFVFLAITRNLGEIRRMRLGWGILIFAAIILPWCIAISLRKPEFFDVFIVQNHFSRFATSTYGRSRPFWFFVPIYFAVAFPWSCFIPAAVTHGLKRDSETRNKVIFLLCWIVTVIAFFSIPRSKLPYYLLPTSVPTAILLGHFFAQWAEDLGTKFPKAALLKWTWYFVILACLVAGQAALIIFFVPIHKAEVVLLKPIFVLGAMVLLGGASVTYYFYKNARNRGAALSLAGMVYGILLVIIVAMRVLSPAQSTVEFAEVLKKELRSEDQMIVYASPDQYSDFLFYIKRKVVIVGSDRGSLQLQSERPENRALAKGFFLSTQDLVRLLNQKETRVFCLMPEKRLGGLKDEGLGEYRVLKKAYKKLLIANF